MSIGSKIRALRENTGLKLGAVYKECGVSTGYLSKIEHGEAEPSREVIDKLAKVFSDERLLGEYDGAQLEQWGYPPVCAELIMAIRTLPRDERDALVAEIYDVLERHTPEPGEGESPAKTLEAGRTPGT
jgi:transcriptional regulator with XRE-family HTH domain